MSYVIREELLQSQDTWKRSQIRLTPTLYQAVSDYAKNNDLSLNSAMIDLMDKALTNQFSVIKDYAGKENHIILNLPTSVIAISPSDYSKLTLQNTIDNWMIIYYGLRAPITNGQAQQLFDIGFEEISYNKYRMKSDRKIIFTEWHPTEVNQGHSPEQNEAVRMACAKFMTEFFQDHPSYKLVSFEFKSEQHKIRGKLREVLYGIRIWYSYPAGE